MVSLQLDVGKSGFNTTTSVSESQKYNLYLFKKGHVTYLTATRWI